MKGIVVTGATSMIGVALIGQCLTQGKEVYAVVRKGSPKVGRLAALERKIPNTGGRLHLVEGELEDLCELPKKIPEKCDVFYHLAWQNTGSNRNQSTLLQSQNIAYTLEAVKTAHALGCRRFIGAGSQAEYGKMEGEKTGSESPVNPDTPYGAAKLGANYLSRMLCRELRMEWIWPRIFSVYGIYEKETAMVASALRKMRKGQVAEFTPATQRWDYLYSKDAGKAMYLLGEHGKSDRIYCVGSGQARPLKEYIEEMAQLTGGSLEGIGARPFLPGTVKNLCADISSLTEDTGFLPGYTFREGIKETLQWLEDTGGTYE